MMSSPTPKIPPSVSRRSRSGGSVEEQTECCAVSSSPSSAASLLSPPKLKRHNLREERHAGSIYSLLSYLVIPLLFFLGKSIRYLISVEQLPLSNKSLGQQASLQDRLRASFLQPRHALMSQTNSQAKKEAEEGTTVWTQNAPSIQFLLRSKRSLWEEFEAFPVNASTSTSDNNPQYKLDVTQNLPRIEDYVHPHASLLGDDQIQKASTPRNLQNESDTAKQQKQQETTTQEPLNIVLFYADDWTMNVLGALNPLIQTPNIDTMAQRGMLFTRNCVTTSICWISRNTLATGVYSAVHQTVELQGLQMFNQTVPWLETLYPLLKRHGYYTGLVGKWHALKPKEFMVNTFDRIKNYYNKHWFIRNGERRHVTDLNQEDAIHFLRNRPAYKRFALTVSFFATHAWEGEYPPYQPMDASMKWHSNQTIPRPKTGTEKHWKQLPWFFDENNMARARWRERFDTPQRYQSNVKNLYRMATEVDAAVGAIVEELKNQGVYEKTLLIFTTDNGNLQGEHGLAEKWYPYEESIRVPLVIQDPRMPEDLKGTRNDDFTLSVDLAPTMLSAAQIPIPKFMQGRDIAQLYLQQSEATKTWRQDFFYEWNQGNPDTAVGHARHSRNTPAVFALIRKDFKYFYWPATRYEQLFRVEKDPYDEFDICNATTTKFALDVMKARYRFLKKWAQVGNPV